jgi:UDP:flavonoid glycosyltransferase YjiC (YdhE family)
MRVLIAWAHGGNFGHVSRQLALAERLKSRGVELVWGVPACRFADTAAIRAQGFKVVGSRQADPDPTPADTARANSYAHQLLRFGFGDAAQLERQTRAWLGLFSHLQPDAVLLDYAPVAQFAAAMSGLLAVQITNGFDAPPPDCPAYELGAAGPYFQQRSAEQIGQINAAFSTVQQLLKRETVTRAVDLARMLQHPVRWIDAVPESDPYGPRECSDGRLRYIGPQSPTTQHPLPSWSTRSAPAASCREPHSVSASHRIFAYLRGASDAYLRALCAASALGGQVLCVWPDADDATIATAKDCAVDVIRHPVNAHEALAGADAVLNYGSSTFVAQALCAGKPQLMVPVDTEKRWASARVAREGAGIVIAPSASEAEVHRAWSRVLTDPGIAARARNIATLRSNLHTAADLAIDGVLASVHARSKAGRSATRLPSVGT